MARAAAYYQVIAQPRMGQPVAVMRSRTEQSARELASLLSTSGQYMAVKLYQVKTNSQGGQAAVHLDTWRNASPITTRQQYAQSIARYGGVAPADNTEET